MSKNIKKVLRKKKRVSQTLPIIAMLAALGVSSLTYSVSVSADSGASGVTRPSFNMLKNKKDGSKRENKDLLEKKGKGLKKGMENSIKPVAAGVIQSISGSLVTIKDRKDQIYTIDVSSAVILRGGRGQASTTIAVSDLKVGDMLGAKGVLTGTNVVATGVMTSPQHPFMKKIHDARTSSK